MIVLWEINFQPFLHFNVYKLSYLLLLLYQQPHVWLCPRIAHIKFDLPFAQLNIAITPLILMFCKLKKKT